MPVAIVVDSTCDLPPEYYAEHGVTMVPLSVRFEKEVLRDWIDIPPERLFERMKGGEVPKTSQPTVGEFAEAYKALADGGATEIVSLHISSDLSGTIGSATVAAKDSPVPVRIVDSRNASLAIALILEKMVEARDAGATGEELERINAAMYPKIRDLYCVDSLKWLEIGGRIGKASALVGTILNIKPILTVTDGLVAPFKKAKGTTRALEEMADAVVADAAGRPVRTTFLYADDRTDLERLKGMLADCGVVLDVRHEGHIGCVVGVYLGPGAFGMIYERNDI